MAQIYITGDTHGDFCWFNMECFPEQKELTQEYFVIILGDFGGVWDVGQESKHEKYRTPEKTTKGTFFTAP